MNQSAIHRLLVRQANRRRARLSSRRGRRSLARTLRLIARDAVDQDPLHRYNDVLLRDRAATVRGDLLEIADLLEHGTDPDARDVEAIYRLARDGISPLYNPAIHPSELHATVQRLRSALGGGAAQSVEDETVTVSKALLVS